MIYKPNLYSKNLIPRMMARISRVVNRKISPHVIVIWGWLCCKSLQMKLYLIVKVTRQNRKGRTKSAANRMLNKVE